MKPSQLFRDGLSRVTLINSRALWGHWPMPLQDQSLECQGFRWPTQMGTILIVFVLNMNNTGSVGSPKGPEIKHFCHLFFGWFSSFEGPHVFNAFQCFCEVPTRYWYIFLLFWQFWNPCRVCKEFKKGPKLSSFAVFCYFKGGFQLFWRLLDPEGGLKRAQYWAFLP